MGPVDPFTHSFVARYVFDSSTNDMVLITSPTSNCIGLHAEVTIPNIGRQNYLASVPTAVYNWPHLPTIPLWIGTYIEMRQTDPVHTSQSTCIQTARSHSILPVSSDLPCTLSDKVQFEFLNTGLKNDILEHTAVSLGATTSSRQAWPVDTCGGLADGLWPAGQVGITDSSSLVFATSMLSSSLTQLSKLMCGLLVAPATRLDIANGSSVLSEPALIKLVPGSMERARRIGIGFANMYYTNVLGVQADQVLLGKATHAGCSNGRDCGAEMNGGNWVCG